MATTNQQSSGSKGKKIQIVYIKVPLAKLRPSLANSSGGSGGYGSAGTKDGASEQQSTSGGSYGNKDGASK